MKPKKEKKDKQVDKEEKPAKKDKADKVKASSSSQAPPKQRGKPLPAGKKEEGGYLDGMDLPSSGSDGEEYEKSARAGDDTNVAQIPSIDAREAKKIADKERIAMEKLHQMKLEALKVKSCLFRLTLPLRPY